MDHFMPNDKPVANAFILTEVLVSVTILAIILGLYWTGFNQYRNNHSHLIDELVTTRIIHDAKVFLELDMREYLVSEAYQPAIAFKWTKSGLLILRPDRSEELLLLP